MNIYQVKKAEALKYAEEYCNRNNLSVDKLRGCGFVAHSGKMNFGAFFKPSEIKPDGLNNDIETMPYYLLNVIKTDNGFNVEETEHTRVYLSN